MRPVGVVWPIGWSASPAQQDSPFVAHATKGREGPRTARLPFCHTRPIGRGAKSGRPAPRKRLRADARGGVPAPLRVRLYDSWLWLLLACGRAPLGHPAGPCGRLCRASLPPWPLGPVAPQARRVRGSVRPRGTRRTSGRWGGGHIRVYTGLLASYRSCRSPSVHLPRRACGPPCPAPLRHGRCACVFGTATATTGAQPPAHHVPSTGCPRAPSRSLRFRRACCTWSGSVASARAVSPGGRWARALAHLRASAPAWRVGAPCLCPPSPPMAPPPVRARPHPAAPCQAAPRVCVAPSPCAPSACRRGHGPPAHAHARRSRRWHPPVRFAAWAGGDRRGQLKKAVSRERKRKISHGIRRFRPVNRPSRR